MYKVSIVAMLLVGAYLPSIQQCGGGDDDDTVVCIEPANGALKPGDWGGEHWLWTVKDDGSVYVETDCAHGTTTEPVIAEDGSFSFALEMVSEAGPVSETGGATFKAEISGTVCGTLNQFTYIVDDTATAGTVEYGKSAQLMKCY